MHRDPANGRVPSTGAVPAKAQGIRQLMTIYGWLGGADGSGRAR